MEELILSANRSRLTGSLVALIGFGVGAVCMLVIAESGLLKVIALACIGACIYSVVKIRRSVLEGPSLVANHNGIVGPMGGLAPWSDVAEIGVWKRSGTKTLGVRLASYERFAKSISDSDARRMVAEGRMVRVAILGLVPLSVANAATGGTNALADGVKGALEAGANVQDYMKVLSTPQRGAVDFLTLTRRASGWDLLWAFATLPEPAERVAAKLQSVRQFHVGVERPPVVGPEPDPVPRGPRAPEAWHPDPAQRHELRWWDGHRWTAHVSDRGQVSSDPV